MPPKCRTGAVANPERSYRIPGFVGDAPRADRRLGAQSGRTREPINAICGRTPYHVSRAEGRSRPGSRRHRRGWWWCSLGDTGLGLTPLVRPDPIRQDILVPAASLGWLHNG